MWEMATNMELSHTVENATRDGVDTRTKDLTGAMTDIDIESGLPAVHLGTCVYCCEEMRVIGEELCVDCFWDWTALRRAPFRCWQQGDHAGQKKAEQELQAMEQVMEKNREQFGLFCVCCGSTYCVDMDEWTQNGFCSQHCYEQSEAVLEEEEYDYDSESESEEEILVPPTCRMCGRCCVGSDYEAERLCSRRCMIKEFHQHDL